jgi:hypothetical protein
MCAQNGGIGLVVGNFKCTVGSKKIVYKCGTYVVVLGFNLGEIMVNSDGHRFNEWLSEGWFSGGHGPHLVPLNDMEFGGITI